MGERDRKVGICMSQYYEEVCNYCPKFRTRISYINELIKGYKLHQIMSDITPNDPTREELLQFHSGEYLNHLEGFSREINKLNAKSMTETADYDYETDDSEEFGLAYDCPPFYEMDVYAKTIVGYTIGAAEALNRGSCQVAINWGGGWHHAKRDEASGFCYMNDVVYGILKLREKHSRVLYVDLDLHHGDGVQEAFELTNKVMTVSFHHYDPGFFPGTGAIDEVGLYKGKFFNVNVPLAGGVDDGMFVDVFCSVMSKVMSKYRPEAIVCQCGADGLATDLKVFNLTLDGYGKCVEYLLKTNIPLLLLGGGGYNFVETAKLWTYLTGLACDVELDVNIPDNVFFDQYGPDFTLSVTPSLMSNGNSKDSCDDYVVRIDSYLANIAD